MAKKKVTQAKRKRVLRQKPRKPITLNEYILKEFKDERHVLMTCYHIDRDVENEDNIDKLTFEVSWSSTTRISFADDDDLLLGSTPYNRPLFVVGYICEQKVNRIFIDDGSVVNILPLNIMKELGVSLDKLSQSRLMIQGFNRDGQSFWKNQA